MPKITCPRCGTRDVRPSVRRPAVDWFFDLFNLVPFRCRNCGTRFRKRILPVETPEDASGE